MMRSPIKWAGGKTRVMPQLLKHLPKADCLIEPFVGSGTVFLNTEYRRYILCDSNRALINFFLALRDDTEKVIAIARNLFRHGNNKESYYRERELFNHLSWDDEYENGCSAIWAASFLYLNRHCYNGLYRTNRDGGFNVPFGRYKSPYFPEAEMRLFAKKARDTHARFLYSDFRSSIPYTAKNCLDSVIYCDPPYIPASKTASFTAYGKPFTQDNHRQLASTLLDAHRQHGTRSVISNSDTPETREIYSAFSLRPLSVRRSVSAKSRDMACEVIGVLRVCVGCGRSGGGNCPDRGPVMKHSTYNAMAKTGAFDDLEAF
ncbi:Dam family site-specific DNA-(adenine-N6)-methyltransferase [Klebsiella variicola]|uniref:DNA adenine methylase n=1 Tax=Klebsiella variicola TaxID=244366 RepID=UPI000F1E653D|nr:Dam family site-specific DNA-(adenine-N6)-methyltransferase [Klebsiella variicola]MBZ7036308.1 Dam family site-specific DNA-(adenine-N6)-methyltransferase [Klebsiella variicola]MDW0346125.1 Dam family site-specific DNA-(adenine-N6)-methyltransferase [Klebsiella variicola]WHE65579.1 Dam family site-specific DNA-(adenine-N6)-methyltransferase [Klebsiella variicola]VCW24137.1 DNA adenine methylase [Klebsiella variicola]HBW0856569.1 Dam family site-specific DNA-(adenine-N6)-methyltransferase [K